MTSRELPVLLVATTLVLSALFVLAFNSVLGGTAAKAPLRATPASDSGPAQRNAPSSKESFPAEAGRPRNREAPPDSKTRDRPAGTTTPASPEQSIPTPSASPVPSTPPPAASPPATPTQPTPAPSPGRGGEDFYSTG